VDEALVLGATSSEPFPKQRHLRMGLAISSVTPTYCYGTASLAWNHQ